MLSRSHLLSGKKKLFVRLSQDRVIRVANYPLQYKVLTGRPVPDEQYWLAKQEATTLKKINYGKGKGKSSLPDWFKRGEIEGGIVPGDSYFISS